MEDKLDNRVKGSRLYENDTLSNLVASLDQIHPLHRKVKFLLDVRGVLKVSGLNGCYVEYGCYLGETLYAAKSILNCFDHYYGVDLFDLPLGVDEDQDNSFDMINSFKSDFKNVSNSFIGFDDVSIIQGDLTWGSTYNSIDSGNNLLSVIDCNFKDALEVSIRHAVKNSVNGGVIFIDDYFTNLERGNPVVHDIFIKTLDTYNKRSIVFNNYPPFAKAFLVFQK